MFLIHFPAENSNWSLVLSISVRDCVQFPTQTLLSLSPVCCALKKLAVNLTADNPVGEVLPVNMYSTYKLGCIISVMSKSCPSDRQASVVGRLCRIFTCFFIIS